MYAQSTRLLAFIALTSLSTESINAVVTTTQNPTEPVQTKLKTNHEESLDVLEDAISALSNLTAVQNRVWDQQRAYEEELLVRNREEEARQAARTTALEEDRHYLRSIWATLSRKLKTLTRNMNKDSQPANMRPKDCADLYLNGEDLSGVYQIWPIWSRTNFSVYCDMETDGGGWTVIHRWGNYSFPQDYFKRSWAEYQSGFGNLETAFWLGNELIYALTSQGAYELRFDMDRHPRNIFAQCRSFWIESSTQYYKVHVESYVSTSTAVDVFSSVNGLPFSTFDNMNNIRNCRGSEIERGWWFDTSCEIHNVFTLSFSPSTTEEHKVLKKEMKIRPAHFQKMKEVA